jgi:hypothetical protein
MKRRLAPERAVILVMPKWSVQSSMHQWVSDPRFALSNPGACFVRTRKPYSYKGFKLTAEVY